MGVPSTIHKDMAEFLRLALIARVCDRAAVVRWADEVIHSTPSPPFVFFDLSTCEPLPLETVLSFLADVPGESTPDLPVHMLLGYCHAPVKSGIFSATDILIRLYGMASAEHFPGNIYHRLLSMEDQLSLARDGVWGTVDEIASRFTGYLSQFVAYAPSLNVEHT